MLLLYINTDNKRNKNMKTHSFFLRHYRKIALSIIPIFWLILFFFIDQPPAYWLEFWWMVPIAFVISLTVNSVGISGAALYVPFFVLIFPLVAFPLSALESVKLSLILESFGLTSSSLSFMAFGLEDKKLAFYSIVGALPFVVMGAFFSLYLPESVLISVVAISFILFIFMVRYNKVLRKERLEQHDQEHVDLTVSHGEERFIRSRDHRVYRYCLTPRGYKKRFLGLGIGGLFQGAAGFGIGEMGLIGMFITKIPVRVAIGTSHLIVAFTAITAALIHVLQSAALGATIPWNIPFMAVPAIIISGQLAPYVDSALSVKKLERFISILFLLIGIALLFVAVKKGIYGVL